MLLKMRGDAQRTADAAALAGASAFLEQPPRCCAGGGRRPGVRVRGRELHRRAARSTRRTDAAPILSGTVWTIASKRRDRRDRAGHLPGAGHRPPRRSPRPCSAKILGIDGAPIQAFAAAEATNAGGAKCVKPFALADTWEESQQTTPTATISGTTARSGSYDRADDYYAPWDGEEIDEPGDPVETGYGSSHRNDNGDLGPRLRPPADHQAAEPAGGPGHQPGPLLRLGDAGRPDRSDPNCANGGRRRRPGLQGHNICECNDAEVYLDTEYDIKPGNMVGPTKHGIKYLTSLDPKAKWVPGPAASGGTVTGVAAGPTGGTARGSSRWRSTTPPRSSSRGGSSIEFNNIALMFLEDYERARGARRTRSSPGSSPSPKARRSGARGPAGQGPPPGRVEGNH